LTQLLVLGGTGFVGPAVVDAAVARGWEVTTFSGHPGSAHAHVRALRGDRMVPETLAAVTDRDWDLVVDTWADDPRAVGWSLVALDDRVDAYAYVSSASVYAQPIAPGYDETARVVDVPPAGAATDYAADKRAAELAVLGAQGGDGTLILRAGAIVGPRENTGRLLYWLRRVADGDPFLAPPPGSPLQWVDVRDLAEFAVIGALGVFNLVCRRDEMTLGDMIEACVTLTGSGATPAWADDAWLQANGVQPWNDLPLWLPAKSPEATLFTADSSRARAAGYAPRDAADSARHLGVAVYAGRCAAARAHPGPRARR
jgi:nucleoside-diphosphate-sugar epimerase